MGVILKIVVVLAVLGIIIGLVRTIMGVGRYSAKDFEFSQSRFKNWEEVLRERVDISVETLHTGEISGTVSGMIDLKDPKVVGIKDAKVTTPVLAHLVKHEKFGCFLIDTGYDSAYADRPWGHGEGLLKKLAFNNMFISKKGQGIDEQLRKRGAGIKGVFFTHFHEHLAGAPGLPHDIPYVFGKGEKETELFPLVFSRSLKDKKDLQAVDFSSAENMPVVGKSIDIFGDGSFWAISTPGHTKGHISYFINGQEEKRLITGDITLSIKGFELGLATNKYCADKEQNKESFKKIREFLGKYPDIKPVFGHESEKFRINY